jgi:hypothetical protein
MKEINGREYPLWEQFVEKQSKWIGGTLQDFGDLMDRAIGLSTPEGMKTTILGIELYANGIESAYFNVIGKDFDCGFDTESGGITIGEEGWITFHGYGGHSWRIKQPEK